MAEPHPDDLQLLAFVEDDLATGERDDVASHVRSCPACAATVDELTRAREALRTAPVLELPRDARKRISADLDARPPARRSYVSTMRLITILAPVAVVVAVVTAVLSLDGPGGRDDAGGGQGAAVAEESAGERDTAEGGGAAPEFEAETGGQQLSGSPLTSVQGPPRAVAAALRAEGFDARVVGRTVVVRGAAPEAVRRALAGRGRGPVTVVLE